MVSKKFVNRITVTATQYAYKIVAGKKVFNSQMAKAKKPKMKFYQNSLTKTIDTV